MENLAAVVTKSNVIKALEKALKEKPPLRKATKYLVKYKNITFPPKEVIRLAAKEQGLAEKNFSNYRLQGGKPTNNYLQKMGFEIIQFSDFVVARVSKKPNRAFKFKPGRTAKSAANKIFKQEEKLVQSIQLHNEIQESLYQHLVQKHGSENVGMESNTGLSTKIDIAVKSKSGMVLYEVKSYPDVTISIREALGQLLEYAYYPTAIPNLKELIIVSHIPIEHTDKQYLDFLRKKTSLKIFYQSIDLHTNLISEKE